MISLGHQMRTCMRTDVSAGALALALAAAALAMAAAPIARAQTPAFHFERICRSDPAVSKNTVTVVLHGPDQAYAGGGYYQVHTGLHGVTINVLWTYVDYRQNRAVFKYRQDSCVTDSKGSCTFHGGSGRARWQLAEVVGYDLSTPAFDMETTALCPNSLMIDFW